MTKTPLGQFQVRLCIPQRDQSSLVSVRFVEAVAELLNLADVQANLAVVAQGNDVAVAKTRDLAPEDLAVAEDNNSGLRCEGSDPVLRRDGGVRCDDGATGDKR